MNPTLKITTLNIGNPSLERAKRQVEWLENRSEDIFILTEAKNSDGCKYIENYFLQYGLDLFTIGTDKQYYVYFPKSSTGDLGVMIISRIPFLDSYTFFSQDSIFYSRLIGIEIPFNENRINIIGMYVPSRDRSDIKVSRKKKFCIETAKYIKSITNKNTIICGDFNILERNHIPHYSTFFEWEYNFYDFFYSQNYIDAFKYCHNDKIEYSWVGRTNDGYRYDYCFVNKNLASMITDCAYLHETRLSPLTDHSAVITSIDIQK